MKEQCIPYQLATAATHV